MVAAGKGAAWAAVLGLAITVLIAATISFQAKRTVSSGSLGTYTGNGLGPGFAYAAGFSLLIGYIGFATTGTLGGVVYLDSFLESVGLGSQATWFRVLLVVVHVDWEQWNPSHLGNSATFIAAVSAVGAYAGFESVASLGAEAKDAHRTIARSLLRVVLLIGVLYIVATYPQILFLSLIHI